MLCSLEIYKRCNGGSYVRTCRFLDRAAMVEHGGSGEGASGAWRLATVTEVEETKLLVATLNFWMTVAQGARAPPSSSSRAA